MKFDLLLKGQVVTPERILPGYVGVKDGLIAEIGDGLLEEDAPKVQDFGSAYILPGAIDGQTHSGSQDGFDGILPATRAAAMGGVTTIVDMPYDVPEPITNSKILQDKIDVVEKDAHVDVALYGTISKQGGVREIPNLIEAGICAFKFSTYETDPKRFARIPPQDMWEAFKKVAPSGLACGVHNENQEVIDAISHSVMAGGQADPLDHSRARPPISETLAMAEIYELGVDTGCRAHVVHCSVDRGFEMCESYKEQGYKVSIETCIQYLSFSEDDLGELGARIKQNPPIRGSGERIKLWDRVRNGQIDFISSDHVAWDIQKKSNNDFAKNASGMPGLATLLPAFYSGCCENGLSITHVAKLLSENVAKHFCIYPQKGAIEVGSDADFAILEVEPYVFDEATIAADSRWSPFHGRQFAGRVSSTFLRGKQIWNGQEVLGPPGFGQFVKPSMNSKSIGRS